MYLSSLIKKSHFCNRQRPLHKVITGQKAEKHRIWDAQAQNIHNTTPMRKIQGTSQKRRRKILRAKKSTARFCVLDLPGMLYSCNLNNSATQVKPEQ